MAADGTVLDANMLFDLCVLDEWKWISKRYGPLVATSLVWDELDARTQSIASRYVECVELSGSELASVADLEAEFLGTLSLSDYSTISVAINRDMRCGSNDLAVYELCRAKRVEPLRGLGILKQMNGEGYLSKAECLKAVQRMREESNLWITDEVVSQWASGLK
jgi:hypothetical protein